MQPLIDKYQINPETNKLFIGICEMFDGQPNYQIWAVKMVFSKTATFDEISEIHDWVTNNQGMVKLLEKQNIVSYSNKTALTQLKKEMNGLNKIALIKNIISHFNTDQRKILTEAILPKEYTALEASNSAVIRKWSDMFGKFSKLPMTRKNNVYTICSSIRNAGELETQIMNALSKKYDWNKEDMLAFMENNTKGCEVVFNQGPYVILRITNFDASKTLCGGGRTQWCITKQESYFKDYTNNGNRDQYFFFDFSRKETDCFAHVGFTIDSGGRGVYCAQTCDNQSMIGDFRQGNEVLNFKKLMENVGVKMSLFMRLKGAFKFEWNIASVIDMLGKTPENFAIAFDNDNRLVVNVLSNTALQTLVGHTFINCSALPVNDSTKAYVILDFNLPLNDDKSIIAMGYYKDQYGTLSLNKMYDIFGNDITKSGYFTTIGISQDSFLNREAIDPKILLHKYIDENDEISAIKLIEKEGKNFDVNYEFNNRIPVFSAVHNHMYNLFDKIVNHPKWDSSIEDGFGEPMLSSLIYLYGSEDVATSKEDEANLKRMMTSLIHSNSIDFNSKDFNNDTVIIIACEFSKMLWVVKSIIGNRKIDINVINDFDCSALSTCIRNKNLEALKLLGKRPDLKVREFDIKLAKQFNINLDEYIKPTESIFNDDKAVASEEEILEAAMAEA